MFILGDSAYPNTKHLVTTYEMNEIQTNVINKILNKKLGGMRYIVECAFGVLKNRFRILLTPLECASHDPKLAVDLITSLLILHNFLIYEKDDIGMDLNVMDSETEESWRLCQKVNGNNREQDETGRNT